MTGDIGTSCNLGGETYEGRLIRFFNATIVTEADQFGQITIDDGSGPTELEDGLLETEARLETIIGTDYVGETLAIVTGVLRYGFGSYEIYPRKESDVLSSVP
eukprot:2968759-Prorocentrum_lima.AAC.1